MSLSMYQASVPVITRVYGNLIKILDKAEAYATAKKIDPSVFINGRLAADMLPLSKQIQIASDVARRGVARLAGAEAPSLPDDEASFAELKQRLTTSIDYLKSFAPAQIDGSSEKEIALKIGHDEMTFTGQDYLLYFVLPNVYFHATTTYAILRHLGVELGKKDYLGAA